jgi:hypothetical protein
MNPTKGKGKTQLNFNKGDTSAALIREGDKPVVEIRNLARTHDSGHGTWTIGYGRGGRSI